MPNIDIDFAMMAPIVAVVVGSLVVLILDLVSPLGRSRPWVFAAALGAVILGAIYGYEQWLSAGAGSGGWAATRTTAAGAYVGDRFALAMQFVILIAAGLTILLSLGWEEFRQDAEQRADNSGYLAVVLLATAGMMVMAASGNLLTLFVGLELLSLALYVLVAFTRRQRVAREAALKYFVLGSVAAGFMLYGFALLYGEVGSLALSEIAAFRQRGAGGGLMMLGLGLAFVGFAFKLALAPFHAWAPDAYQGAPTPVAAFMAVGTKVAAFAALYRFAVAAVPAPSWDAVLFPVAVLAVASMAIGSLGGLVQRDVKRLLAYSAISHAGYLILALASPTELGARAGFFYLVSYGFTIIGAFAVLMWVSHGRWGGTGLQALSGLYYRDPWPAAAFTLFLLSATGMPPTGGFVGKLLLAMAGVEGEAWLLIAGLVLTTGISAYVYLKVVRTLFDRSAEAVSRTFAPQTAGLLAVRPLAAAGDGPGAQLAAGARIEPARGSTGAAGDGELTCGGAWALGLVIALCAGGTLALGVAPQWLLEGVSGLLPLP